MHKSQALCLCSMYNRETSKILFFPSCLSVNNIQPRRVTAVPNHYLRHTSDFLNSAEQFSVTINTGRVSPGPIDRLWRSETKQRSARSTPSHIVISVTDLEVKFNFPLQRRCPGGSPEEAACEFRGHFLCPRAGYYNL